MFGENEFDTATDNAVKNPKVGDRFSEMYSWYLYVIGVDEQSVVTIDASVPCTLPEDGDVNVWSRQGFIDYLSYNGIPGYWARYIDGGHNVEGWLPDWAAAQLSSAPKLNNEWWW